MKKVFGVVLLLCLLVFSKTVFADTSHAPFLEGQQIEMTTNQINLDIESLVITPVKFVEVEISPGDNLETTILIKNKNKIDIKEINTLYILTDSEYNKSSRIDKLRNSLNSKLTLSFYAKITGDTKGRCLDTGELSDHTII